MNKEDYKKAKQECLIKFCDEHSINHNIDILVKGAFGYAFDYAYRLGMEAAKKEQQTEPKFKAGDMVRVTERDHSLYGEVVTIDTLVSGIIPEVLVNCGGNLFSVPISGVEPYTEPQENFCGVENQVKECVGTEDGSDIAQRLIFLEHQSKKHSDAANCNKDFDNIVKDNFRNYNRLHISAMFMQGILANSSLIERYFAFGENENKIARHALIYADALLEEAQKGGKQI